ncbi:uncharacterized protein LOC120256894 [Dioscorea cayenensis subsp. rotundata]|uniref:Uncharacterized protein LOC120256894 n=1 Tax=Dioscorea cayennensis subsp. rotundata TaxID=55577 RepID=A0AB40AZQ3_DIOCR|nr:uncharacterized protein LOC120256894 [Dioscorea cayenensis subsp. rotundata]
MPLPPRVFRINAKNIFLTYSKCSLSKEYTIEKLRALSLTSNKKFIRVARELHEDGTPHLHVLIQFEGRIQVTNQRLFDIVSPHSSAIFHPNIQSAKSSKDVKAYIEKGGDFLDWGTFQEDPRNSRNRGQALDDVYDDALKSTSAEEALQIIRINDPRIFTLQYHNLRANYERLFYKPLDPYISFWEYSSFNITRIMNEWLEHNFQINCAAQPVEI